MDNPERHKSSRQSNNPANSSSPISRPEKTFGNDLLGPSFSAYDP
jgi:hypothetical protein